MPRAFITGITGQDGQHLAEFLHGQGYDVYGMVKGQNNPKATQVVEEMPFVELVPGDLADLPSLVAALEIAQPDEVYNLGAISFVALSFSQAELTANTTGLGVLRMLEAIRMIGGTQNNPIRFYQASSSEMFGKVRETPQNERTPFHPRSPYGCAKVFGHDITVNYRESYGLYACSGILFNHEGPRRGIEFVTRKVTNAAARIKLGLQHELVMGTLDTKRDWGYAGDYVRAMWLMLQQPEPDDYVVATGETHSIRELVDRAFAEAGIDDWSRFVRQDRKFYRPAEVDLLIGDATKAREPAGVAAGGRLPVPRQDDGGPRPAHRGRPKPASRPDPSEVFARTGGVRAPRPVRKPSGGPKPSDAVYVYVSRGMSVIASSTEPVSGTAPIASLWRSARAKAAIAATDETRSPISTRTEQVVARQPGREQEGDDAGGPAEGDEGVPLERDDRLGEGEGDHVARRAESEHGERAPGQVGVVDDLDHERPEDERADRADDPTASTSTIRRRSPARNSSSSPVAARRLRRGSRAACTAWNMNNGMRASRTP